MSRTSKHVAMLASVAGLSVAAATSLDAFAGSASYSYAAITTGYCLNANPNFGANMTASGGTTVYQTSSRTLQFDLDGTGKSIASNSLFITRSKIDAASNEPDWLFTWAMNAAGDGTFTVTRQAYTNSGGTQYSGFTSEGRFFDNGKTITLVTVTPQVQTVTRSTGYVYQRICTRSTTARLLPQSPNGLGQGRDSTEHR